MDFSDLLREEKCNSLLYLRNKLSKLQFFNLWYQKYSRKLNNSSEELKFNLIFKNYYKKKKLRRYFNLWNSRISDQSLTETRLSSINSNINENDSRYQEFYNDLQDLSLKNAELKTKRSMLIDKIDEIQGLIDQVGSIFQQKKDKLTISASRNEILLRQLAELKLQRRNEIINMQTKLSDAQKSKLSMSQIQDKKETLSKEESFSIVQNAQDSYNAKINGIKVRLKCYKDDALKTRTKYQQAQQENSKLEKEIKQLEKKVQNKENEIDSIENQEIVEPQFDEETKDLLNDIKNQLQTTRDAILANEVKITKNISQIRTLKMRIMQSDYK